MLLGFAALGFGLFTGPVLQNLYLDRHFHLGTFGRGVVVTVTGVGVLVALPFVAKRYDALYRRDPAAGAADDRPVDHAGRGAPPDPVLHAERDALRDRRDPARRAAPQRVHHGGADHPVGGAATDCAVWASRSARSTCSSSARPAARSSPRCSPARSGRAARCCWSASRRRSSAGC